LLSLEVSEDQHKGEKRPGMSGGHVEGNPINFKELIQSGSQNTEQMHFYNVQPPAIQVTSALQLLQAGHVIYNADPQLHSLVW
jgi:hypothetical protein